MRGLTTPKWLVTHAAVIVFVLLCVGLGWWQLGRAEAGNLRSYGYAAEWPSLALLMIGFWVKIVRDELRGTPPGGSRDDTERAARFGARRRRSAAREADAAELAAYNNYVAERARRAAGDP